MNIETAKRLLPMLDEMLDRCNACVALAKEEMVERRLVLLNLVGTRLEEITKGDLNLLLVSFMIHVFKEGR